MFSKSETGLTGIIQEMWRHLNCNCCMFPVSVRLWSVLSFFWEGYGKMTVWNFYRQLVFMWKPEVTGWANFVWNTWKLKVNQKCYWNSLVYYWIVGCLAYESIAILFGSKYCSFLKWTEKTVGSLVFPQTRELNCCDYVQPPKCFIVRKTSDASFLCNCWEVEKYIWILFGM